MIATSSSKGPAARKPGRVAGQAPETRARDRETEHNLGVLGQLANRLALPLDLDDMMASCLDTALKLSECSVGALVLVDASTRRVTRCTEKGLSRDFLASHVLPDLFRRAQQSLASIRSPALRTFVSSDDSQPDRGTPAPFQLALVPLVWDKTLKGVAAVAGSPEGEPDLAIFGVFQSLVTSNLAMRERFGIVEKAKAEWEKTFDALQDAVFMTDLGGRILRANLKTASLVGCDIRNLVGSQCGEVLHGRLCPNRACMLPQVCRESRAIVVDDNPSGDTWHRVRVYPIQGPEGSLIGTLHWVSDISEMKRLQRTAREAEILRAERNKLASLERLMDSLAHDLRNPLTYLMGTASRLEMVRPELEECHLIVEQALRMKAILDNIVSKGRERESQATQTVDLNEILIAEVANLESDPFYAPHTHRDVRLDPDLPPVQGVPADFSTSVANVLVNALHAMWRQEHPVLAVSSAHDDEFIVLEIADTGVGIAPENLPRIFEPLFTTKPSAGAPGACQPAGSGLGLASVEQLLRPYGAVFRVDSEPGRGTRFSIRFPRRPVPSAREDRGDSRRG